MLTTYPTTRTAPDSTHIRRLEEQFKEAVSKKMSGLRPYTYLDTLNNTAHGAYVSAPAVDGKPMVITFGVGRTVGCVGFTVLFRAESHEQKLRFLNATVDVSVDVDHLGLDTDTNRLIRDMVPWEKFVDDLEFPGEVSGSVEDSVAFAAPWVVEKLGCLAEAQACMSALMAGRR